MPTPPTGRAFKDAVYTQLARVGKALASPVRLEVLDLLGQAPRTVEALAEELGATVANTSQHLQVLKGAQLVETERRGQHVRYRLADASVSGALSDRSGRQGLVAWGMAVQAVGIGVLATGDSVPAFALGQSLLGLGTAMVYPTILAAIGDVAHPTWRASAMGTYRLWRDLGYAIGALLSGIAADQFGVPAALWLVAALTLTSGGLVSVRMRETPRAQG